MLSDIQKLHERFPNKLDGALVMEPLSASEEVLLSLFNTDSLFNQHGNAIIRNQMLSDDTKREV